jgi:putative ABC transport system ATP-binding protein
MGPSGSGKSTLLNILGCLDRPTQGRYFFEGREVEILDPDELARIRLYEIGFIFQSFHLIPRLDALANIELPMILAKLSRTERRKRALDALRSVGLEAWADHRPSELSGGQKQRVAIARAIAMKPRILLADEPTGNLDTQSGEQILAILEDLRQQGITLAVVTHDPAVARHADRILALRDGEIVQRLSAAEFTDASALSISGKTEVHP